MARHITLNLQHVPSDAVRSWWFDDVRSSARGIVLDPELPPLTGNREADVAIVGGGFTGLWTALALKARNPSLDIALVEAGRCGRGASGKNGGKCHGYWGNLPGLVRILGPDGALAVCRASSKAQDGIRAFLGDRKADVWWREAGHAKVSTSIAQDGKRAALLAIARELGVADMVIGLDPRETQDLCKSPPFRSSVFFPEGANLHPARLVEALKAAARAAGVSIHERSPMTRLETGVPNRVVTAGGAILAREVVLAANTGLANLDAVRPHLAVFSSYALMTDPVPDRLAEIGWSGGVGLSDLRMFVHYFRNTPDGRVLMGSGSGPIAFANDDLGAAMTQNRQTLGRARAGLARLLPGLGTAGIAGEWGGAIDVSADRLPFFRTVEGTRVHFAAGFSGHGINPTYIAGQCLASLVLSQRDEWTSLPFCTRAPATFPSEPLRTLGGRLVRWGIMASEDAEDRGNRPPPLASCTAALPRLFGIRVGTR